MYLLHLLGKSFFFHLMYIVDYLSLYVIYVIYINITYYIIFTYYFNNYIHFSVYFIVLRHTYQFILES